MFNTFKADKINRLVISSSQTGGDGENDDVLNGVCKNISNNLN
jgi:hypothetical protein